jgi:hypothetical protein
MTNDDYYADLDDATTEQALETILDILENQEEGITLLGKQEWMEAWPEQDINHTLLSNHELFPTRLRKSRWEYKGSLVLCHRGKLRYQQPSETRESDNQQSPVAYYYQHQLL